jgi:hypothetical protein
MNLNKLTSELTYERAEIEKALRQSESINSMYTDSQLTVQQNYYNYIVYFFVTLLLIMLFIRFGIGGEERNQVGGWFKKVKIIKS